MKIVPLPDGVTYAHASTAIRRLGVSVDAWLVPPAGLFVAEERTVYLRTISSMTVVHELGHALDCALGGRHLPQRHRSDDPPRIREHHAVRDTVRRGGLDEFFAENWRAYLGANDPTSFWPTVTRARLEACAPTMYALFEGIDL